MENKKLIITIGRQIGSGGRVIGRQLAKDFGCEFFDKELLNLAAKESGFSAEFLEQNDEEKGFFRSRFHMHIPILGENNFYYNDFSQESLYRFQCDAIRKAADSSSCVFVGRTADYILRDRTDIVNIFITADMCDRIDHVCKRKDCDRAEAEKMINNRESGRASYYNYYTGKRWGHSDSYDLCINSSRLGIEGTEQFIADFIKRKFGLL